jgi:hypothetical protein
MLIALHLGGFVTLENLNLINMTAYILAIFVWLGYSLSRKAVREGTANRLQTQRWEQSLADLQPAVASDSLIPMFEGMVERALLRSSNLEGAEDHFPLNRPGDLPRANSAAVGSKTRP